MVEIQIRGVGEEALTRMKSPTEKGLKNWRDTPLSMFPRRSFAANAVATPVTQWNAFLWI
jgi:hypothetical protein